MKKRMNITDQKGGVLVEFAIVLPLLILLIAGILEFGILLYNKHVITNASREGARAGIVAETTDGEIREVVNKFCPNLITFGQDVCPLQPSSIIINDGSGIATTGYLKVHVVFDYEFLLPSVLGLGSPIQVAAETVMEMEPT